MLSSSDHTGTVTFLVGVIILVMAGVGLTLVVDYRFGYSNRASDLERMIEGEAEQLETLTARHQYVLRRLIEVAPKRLSDCETYESTRARLAELDRKGSVLAASRDRICQSMVGLEEGFANYREKYRKATWRAAAGESLGELKVRGGRQYHQAVITRVTEVGLEIRHQHGIARVHAPDLESGLQDRFQWNDEERRLRLKRELANREGIGQSRNEGFATDTKARESSHGGQWTERPETDVERRKVFKLKSRVAKLTQERDEAVIAAAYSSKTSVPGSLETWQARAERLAAELAKVRAELAVAELARHGEVSADGF